MTNQTTTETATNLSLLDVALVKSERLNTSRLATGNWMHIFGPGSRESRCRILIDLEKSSLIGAQEWTGLQFEHVVGERLKDLAESVITANCAHEDPSQWGLHEVAETPEWAVPGRQEMLQALGFSDEAEYQEHWRVLLASKDLAVTQMMDSIAAGSTAFTHEESNPLRSAIAMTRSFVQRFLRVQAR